MTRAIHHKILNACIFVGDDDDEIETACFLQINAVFHGESTRVDVGHGGFLSGASRQETQRYDDGENNI